MNAEAQNVAVGMFAGVALFFTAVFISLWVLEKMWRMFNAPLRFITKTLFTVFAGVLAHYLSTNLFGISITEGTAAGIMTSLVLAVLARDSEKS